MAKFFLQFRDESGRIERFTFPGNHYRGDGLAEIGVRDADDRGLRHAGQRVERQFDFLGINVVATADDQVLGTPDDGNISIGIKRTDVARTEITVRGEFLAGLIRHAPVAGKYIVALDLNAADFTARQWTIVIVRHSDRYARKRKTDTAAATLPVQRVGADHSGFGHAIAFQDGLTGACLELLERLELQGSGTGDEQAHTAAGIAVEPVFGQQPCIERRYAHHDRRARKIAQHQFRIELSVP